MIARGELSRTSSTVLCDAEEFATTTLAYGDNIDTPMMQGYLARPCVQESLDAKRNGTPQPWEVRRLGSRLQ